MANTDKKLIPTENLIGKRVDGFIEKRAVTSIWVDAKTHKNFIEACAIAGRKTCSVIESFERAFTKCVKNHIEKSDICSVKPIVFDHLTINISEKYDKRGPKDVAKTVSCPLSGNVVHIDGPALFTCKYECHFAIGCKTYEVARFQ